MDTNKSYQQVNFSSTAILVDQGVQTDPDNSNNANPFSIDDVDASKHNPLNNQSSENTGGVTPTHKDADLDSPQLSERSVNIDDLDHEDV